MEPLLAVWAGLTLNNGGIVSGAALDPYVDDIMRELEVGSNARRELLSIKSHANQQIVCTW